MIDFQIMEAVSVRVQIEDAQIQKKAAQEKERQDFKQDFSELDQYR